MFNKVNNKGILVSNVIYIVIVISFFAMLFIFAYRYGSPTALTEQRVAKQISLAIDAAEPGTKIRINLEGVLEDWEREVVGNPIRIEQNIVTVELSGKSKGGYSYSFFNDVDVEDFLDKETGFLILNIGVKNEN